MYDVYNVLYCSVISESDINVLPTLVPLSPAPGLKRPHEIHNKDTCIDVIAGVIPATLVVGLGGTKWSLTTPNICA